MKGDLRVILATDCGSTTTKAILIEKKGEEYRQTYRGEAPTTVEAPFEDVTRGVLNAIQEIEELSGRRILQGERIISPAREGEGVDIYISTSSAGGGLQMMVAGAVKSMTAESAQRCALGAGAIVMDIMASNDGRMGYEKIERIRQLRPDMILLSGGTDGGTVSHVVELAEYIAAAEPKPRLGHGYRLPVIFAGNRDARQQIREILGDKTALYITENIRPVLEKENLLPARNKIHELFLEHVMAQAPGYRKLMEWVATPIMPTPAAVGYIMETVARIEGLNVLGVDIGGATTDVFSVFEGIFNRSVSANLGMSYSVSNVLAEAGIENIMRWIPLPMDQKEVRNRIKNKMIRPTTIPQTLEDLILEHAIAREALRLALEQHKQLAVGLKGIQQERSIADVFDQRSTGQTLVDMVKLDLLIGSGGILSHAPRRVQALQIMLDAFQPVGITRLAVDSIFMMPQLGVLAKVDEGAALEVFRRDCLIHLGCCIAPLGGGKIGERCLDYEINFSDQRTIRDSLPFGAIRVYPLGPEEEAEVEVLPHKGFDLGLGKGKRLRAKVRGGVVGLVIDARGRPLVLSQREEERRRQLIDWWRVLDLYPTF